MIRINNEVYVTAFRFSYGILLLILGAGIENEIYAWTLRPTFVL